MKKVRVDCIKNEKTFVSQKDFKCDCCCEVFSKGELVKTFKCFDFGNTFTLTYCKNCEGKYQIIKENL